MTNSAKSRDEWLTKWLHAVEDGSATMSQRARSSIDRNGGLDAAITAAKACGVHLVDLTDDKVSLLVSTSRHLFTSLCRSIDGNERESDVSGKAYGAWLTAGFDMWMLSAHAASVMALRTARLAAGGQPLPRLKQSRW